MIREEIRDNIAVDRDMQYCMEENFDYDQVYDSFPCVFPTVRIHLQSSNGLNMLADRLRQDNGKLPFFDFNGTAGEYDDDGWYDFEINLNGYNNHHIDIFILACEGGGGICEPQYDDEHYIYLSEEEQEYIYQCLDKELVGCEDLLKHSADYHKHYYGEELTILERRTA